MRMLVSISFLWVVAEIVKIQFKTLQETVYAIWIRFWNELLLKKATEMKFACVMIMENRILQPIHNVYHFIRLETCHIWLISFILAVAETKNV